MTPKIEINFNVYQANIRNAPEEHHKYKENFGFWQLNPLSKM